MVGIMKEYSLSDLNRRTGEMTDIAMAEPVALLKRGRKVLVLMSAGHYEALAAGQDPAQDEAKPAREPLAPGKPEPRTSKLKGLAGTTEVEEEL